MLKGLILIKMLQIYVLMMQQLQNLPPILHLLRQYCLVRLTSVFFTFNLRQTYFIQLTIYLYLQKGFFKQLKIFVNLLYFNKVFCCPKINLIQNQVSMAHQIYQINDQFQSVSFIKILCLILNHQVLKLLLSLLITFYLLRFINNSDQA